jgi:hypothetical protein
MSCCSVVFVELSWLLRNGETGVNSCFSEESPNYSTNNFEGQQRCKRATTQHAKLGYIVYQTADYSGSRQMEQNNQQLPFP